MFFKIATAAILDLEVKLEMAAILKTVILTTYLSVLGGT